MESKESGRPAKAFYLPWRHSGMQPAAEWPGAASGMKPMMRADVSHGARCRARQGRGTDAAVGGRPGNLRAVQADTREAEAPSRAMGPGNGWCLKLSEATMVVETAVETEAVSMP